VSGEEFSERTARGEMLESKLVFTNWYGTSKQSYHDILKAGSIPLMDVDLEGMKDIRKTVRMEGLGEAEVLCLLPPSWEVLKERLSKRGTERKEALHQRME
jgi:guanylate kinase